MTRKISSEVLKKDRESLVALEAMAGYAPRNELHAADKLRAREQDLESAESRMLRARAELDAATDAYYAAAVTFHDGIVGARDEVKVQFGDSSDEYAAVGRTKSSERKAPKRRTAKTIA